MAASAEGNESDPNLTPLLDVVLQLIMFFMITVNFVRVEPLSEQVKLPVAQSAVVLDDAGENWVYLNVARPAPPPETAQELIEALSKRHWFEPAVRKELAELQEVRFDAKQAKKSHARKLADDLRQKGLLTQLQIDQIFYDQGRLIVLGEDLDDKDKLGDKLEAYLQNRKKDFEGLARQRQFKGDLRITVIVSADGDVPAQRVWEILDIADKVGFKIAKLRALTRSLES